ncbi:thioredoxin domain-containing protein [Candidatus Methanocrinis natronophilus]|uniref:Thioredoxin domain-containing protein n=1 Tax=Candidatus Methanocrinis natronophilus TaxID=3033396 RepID=A0ABT5X793_9EURY|nr:thioredoxin domain-containing protein [Candidatus Methanocrinis natronophilus]MDF0590574.1 thioredoxin domain-containing protein [Candidatus Methanocrinis natronophilus]
MAKRKNRLAFESSPYLLQHQDNPVDWHPWGEEAFRKAKDQDKPVFLSIGYSTCHWCHVMARESFEDEEVAGLLNATFVCIKVDREERPDIDAIYMNVASMMTGSGGWPLNVILTPEKKPFFAATYIPRESRFGRIGILDLVPRIGLLWRTERNELLNSAEEVTAALQRMPPEVPGRSLDETAIRQAYQSLVARFDARNGGFGGAPKFPSAATFLFLLRHARRTGDPGGLSMTEITLNAMRRGGIFDQIGYGFHRYSTDAAWLLPHFEKMLYDQAMIAIGCLEAHQASGDGRYGRIAREVFEYVLRDLRSPEGGFYSAEDADSEGEEGKFYLWTKDELYTVLEGNEADLAARVFDVQEGGNFREEATGKLTGKNVLHLKSPLGEVAEELGVEEFQLTETMEAARRKLFSAREERTRPLLDDKILADWNGLAIAALGKGAQVFGDEALEEAASKAADFVLERMLDGEGRLLHRYREGSAGILGNLDDYAFFIWGLLELYEAGFDVKYLRAAKDLAGDMVRRFHDGKGGGFYFSPVDGEELILRRKDGHDGALPSGNAVAAFDLLRLAKMTADSSLEEIASKAFGAFAPRARAVPAAHLHLLSALDFALGPASEVVIVGDPTSPDTRDMIRALRSEFFPGTVLLFKEVGDRPEISEVAEFTRDLIMVDGKTTAYVCRGHVCQMPTTDPKEMLAMLRPAGGS